MLKVKELRQMVYSTKHLLAHLSHTHTVLQEHNLAIPSYSPPTNKRQGNTKRELHCKTQLKKEKQMGLGNNY